MKTEILKKIGKFAIVLSILFLATSLFSKGLVVTLDDNRIGVGETTSLKIKIDSDSDSLDPSYVPKVRGLNIQYSGSQKRFEYINGKSWSGTVLVFSVTALKRGSYTIPAFRFKRGNQIVKTNSVHLTVLRNSIHRRHSARNNFFSPFDEPDSDENFNRHSEPAPIILRTKIEVSNEKICSGQTVVMRYFVLSSHGADFKINGLEKQPEAKGFMVKKSDDNLEDRVVTIDDVDYTEQNILTYILVPASSGNFKIGGGSIIISTNSGNGFFGFPRRKRLIFDYKNISVLNLPKKNIPNGFKGNVGDFKMSVDFTPKKIKAYDEFKINITISGKGNLITLNKPFFENKNPNVKIIFDETDDNIKLKGNTIAGNKKYTMTLIPEKKGEYNLGKILFTYFNPIEKKYFVLKSKDISFTAISNGEDARGEVAFDKDESQNKDSFNYIFIIVIVLGFVAILTFVIVWEKRRFDSVMPVEDKKKDETEITKDENKNLINNLESALKETNQEDALRYAEKLSDLLLEKFEIIGNREKKEMIIAIKEHLYSVKFGGKKLSQTELEELLSQIVSEAKNF